MTRELEHAAAGMEKVIAQSLRLAPAGDAPLLAWPVVCGSAVAQRTRAMSVQNGILCVEVPDAGWKAELQSLAPRYVAAIQRYAPDAVRRIEFVIVAPEKR
jgi:predicted nucleic acid-binding Zn ribbon protein